ncbi:hypothetical protein SSX86_008551 [Deinandra increscens subsp. villosa]|uniref:Uncharacterized protein n=1 Tax=Deinandra increscens subsp. villosa TaxID=3103831 RepID=A0AAP0H451_9ASTR
MFTLRKRKKTHTLQAQTATSIPSPTIAGAPPPKSNSNPLLGTPLPSVLPPVLIPHQVLRLRRGTLIPHPNIVGAPFDSPEPAPIQLNSTPPSSTTAPPCPPSLMPNCTRIRLTYPCHVCYLLVDEAMASMPSATSTLVVQHLTYFHEEASTKTEPHEGSNFGGYPSIKLEDLVQQSEEERKQFKRL